MIINWFEESKKFAHVSSISCKSVEKLYFALTVRVDLVSHLYEVDVVGNGQKLQREAVGTSRILRMRY